MKLKDITEWSPRWSTPLGKLREVMELPAPTYPANAGVSLAGRTPPAPRTRFSFTHPSLYALLSSAYPFSACSNRQPFVFEIHERVRLPISYFHTF